MALTKITGEGVGAIDSLGIGTSTNAATLTVSHASGTDGRGIRLVNSSNNQTYENRIGTEGIENTSYSVRDITADVVRFSISSDGEVTMPSQPAFSVHPASTQSNVAINTSVTVVFGTEVFDVGGNFTSNTFTAPVTGKYLLTTNLALQEFDASADYFQTEISTSNRNYAVIVESSSSDHDHFNNASLAVVADMDANDTAIVRVFQGSGAAQVDILTDSDFTGALIC